MYISRLCTHTNTHTSMLEGFKHVKQFCVSISINIVCQGIFNMNVLFKMNEYINMSIMYAFNKVNIIDISIYSFILKSTLMLKILMLNYCSLGFFFGLYHYIFFFHLYIVSNLTLFLSASKFST